jgi:hypothetical protein
LVLTRAGAMRISGAYQEYGRVTPLGHWIVFTPVLTASAGATVAVTTNVTCSYTLIGRTMILSVHLAITITGGPPPEVYLALPAGFTGTNYTASACFNTAVPGGGGLVQARPGVGFLTLLKDATGGLPWPTGAQTIIATHAFPV